MSTRCVLPTLIIVFYFGLNTFNNAAPYQELHSQPGYIPVYIREGDTSLADINLQLAEAFNEIDSMNFKGQESDNGHTSAADPDSDGDVFVVIEQVEAKPPAVSEAEVPVIFDSHVSDNGKADVEFTAPLRPKEKTTDVTSFNAMRTDSEHDVGTFEKERKYEAEAAAAEIRRNDEAKTAPSIAN